MIKQEAQGLGALLDKMEDNDHIKLDNIRHLGVGGHVKVSTQKIQKNKKDLYLYFGFNPTEIFVS